MHVARVFAQNESHMKVILTNVEMQSHLQILYIQTFY